MPNWKKVYISLMLQRVLSHVLSFINLCVRRLSIFGAVWNGRQPEHRSSQMFKIMKPVSGVCFTVAINQSSFVFVLSLSQVLRPNQVSEKSNQTCFTCRTPQRRKRALKVGKQKITTTKSSHTHTHTQLHTRLVLCQIWVEYNKT